MVSSPPCPVCAQNTSLFDVLDFNRSCSDLSGKPSELSGLAIYYALCPHCGFCFAPEMAQWPPSQFAQWVYNEDYIRFDPDYQDRRPRGNAAQLQSLFGQAMQGQRHLDYGSGEGLLSRVLQEAGWQSSAYDPYSSAQADSKPLGHFDLITAFEVFEHVPQPLELMRELNHLLAPTGLIVFSTLLSDTHLSQEHGLRWWYAAPRNGHISLFSRRSLETLAGQFGMQLGSFSEGLHILFRQVPPWARHLFTPGTSG